MLVSDFGLVSLMLECDLCVPGDHGCSDELGLKGHSSIIVDTSASSTVRCRMAPGQPYPARSLLRLPELAGYWTRAARHPLWWLDPVMPDLGLTPMARGRYAVSTGELLSKTRH